MCECEKERKSDDKQNFFCFAFLFYCFAFWLPNGRRNGMELAALTSMYGNVVDSDDDGDNNGDSAQKEVPQKRDRDIETTGEGEEKDFGSSFEYVAQPAFKRAKIQAVPTVEPLIAVSTHRSLCLSRILPTETEKTMKTTCLMVFDDV